MLSISDIRAAQKRIADVRRRTPLEQSRNFSAMADAQVFLKLENMQRTGSFKIRGATNKIRQLGDDEVRNGIITASAGNHAQGVALAATESGIDATIVMPEYAPHSKAQATRGYGGTVVRHGTTYDQAAEHAREIAGSRPYIHAFDDTAIMAGQGTLGLEIADQCPNADTVVVPVGGGGLISGTAVALKETLQDVRIIGVQAAGASSAAQSLEKGTRVTSEPQTVADGIAVGTVGEKPFSIIQESVDDIVTVSDDMIATSVMYALERSKTVFEGAGAVALAAILDEAFDYQSDEQIVAACCGGNIDMETLQSMVEQGMIQTGRYTRLRVRMLDRAGALADVTDTIASYNANISRIEHDRSSEDVSMNEAAVTLELRTRGPRHIESIVTQLQDNGYHVTEVTEKTAFDGRG